MDATQAELNRAGDAVAQEINMIESALNQVSNEANASVNDLLNNISNIGPFISGMIDSFTYKVQSQGGVDVSGGKLFDSFIWASLCVGALSVGEICGHNPQGVSIMSMLTTKTVAQFLGLVVLPLWFYCKVRDEGGDNRRFTTVLLSFAIGMCVGYSIAPKRMDMSTPPAFALPVMMALVTQALPSGGMDRIQFLGIVLGACFCTNMMIGIGMRQVNGNFFMEQLVTLAVSLCNVQITIAAGSQTELVHSSLAWVMLTVALDMIVVFCFSGPGPQEEQ